MINFFVAGICLYLIIFFFRASLVFIVSKVYKENFKENFEFNIFVSFIEALVYGVLFSFLYLLTNQNNEDSFQNIIICIVFICFIPSYIFLFSPLQYLYNNNASYYDDENLKKLLEKRFKNKYNIKVIDKNIINAFATGVMPFSKTILIGKPLIDKMKKEEVLSILLHEAGHLRLNHLKKLYFVNLFLSSLAYGLFFIRSQYFSVSDGILNIITVGITGCLLGFLLWYFPSKFQYKLELQADLFSARLNGVDNLKNALIKLDEISNGDVSKGGYTHPTLQKRFKNLEINS